MIELYQSNVVWLEPLLVTGLLAIGLWLLHLSDNEAKKREKEIVESLEQSKKYLTETSAKVMVASGAFTRWR